MQALAFVLSMQPAVPYSVERACQPATNSEIRRWFKNRAVRINGQLPDWNDSITLPVTDLVFFQNSKRKTTVL